MTRCDCKYFDATLGLCRCPSRTTSSVVASHPCIFPCEDSRAERCKYFCAAVPQKPVERESLEKNVNHPNRYTKGKVECIDALESAVVGKPPDEAVCVANVIKYLWRYEEKEPVRSLLSAKWYLDRLIEKAKEHYES